MSMLPARLSSPVMENTQFLDNYIKCPERHNYVKVQESELKGKKGK